MKRVVITGLGAVSPVGNDTDSTWEALKSGQNGIDKITLFDPSRSKVHLVAEVKNFDYSGYIDAKSAKRMDRFTQFVVCAAKMAYEDSGLGNSDFDRSDVRVVIGSGIGGLQTIQEQIEKLTLKGPGKVSPFFIPSSIVNIAPAHVSMELGFQGPCTAIVTACASGTDAVGDAFRSIRDGYHSIAFAGGCEAAITESGIAGFANMTALHSGDDRNRASIPFDKDRSGFVMGEGSGVLVLEELEHALARNAKIYAEITGYGQSCDAYHITSPDPEGKGAIKAMQRALSDAAVTPDQIDYINAHLTEDLSIEKLSSHFYINRYYLMHIFRDETGGTVGNYISSKRLLMARNMIRSGTAATQACFGCGFGNYSAFYRAYKKEYGISPGTSVICKDDMLQE